MRQIEADQIPVVPLDPDYELEYLNSPDEWGLHDRVYRIASDNLADKYAIRPMNFLQEGGRWQSSLQEQYALHMAEISRLSESGVAVPRMVAALPDGWETPISADSVADQQSPDVMLAAEQLIPVDMATVDPDLLDVQARKMISGLTTYLADSWSLPRQQQGALYLNDVFSHMQFMYARPKDSEQADFYMIDVEGRYRAASPLVDGQGARVSLPEHLQEHISEILDTAKRCAKDIGDDSLVAYAEQQLSSVHIPGADLSKIINA
jgi:hypothetical protein